MIEDPVTRSGALRIQIEESVEYSHAAASYHGVVKEFRAAWKGQMKSPADNSYGRRHLVVNLVSETVDSAQGHGVHTAFLQTRSALEGAGVEVRVNDGRRCDIVHIQTMGLRSLRCLLAARDRVVVTAHIVPESLVGSFTLASLWLPIGTAYLKFFYSLAHEVLAVSPDVVDGLDCLDLGVPVRFVPNAVEVDRFLPRDGWREETRAQAGIADDEFVVVCAGQIQPRKGVDAFMAAARAMPDITFVWVGGMPFGRLTAGYREMRRKVREAPSNCRFVGEVAYGRMPLWFAAADCLFFPSHQETFGLAVIEAAAAGLPLVLRDIDTYTRLFGDSYLAGSEDSFTGLLARLRDDAVLREEYSRRSRDMAAAFDTARLADRLLEVYAEVSLMPERAAWRGKRLRPAFQNPFDDRSARR